MKWFILRLRTDMETGTVNKSVYEFDIYENALKSFYGYLSSDIGNQDLSECLCMIIQPDGSVTDKKYFTRHQVAE